MHLGVVLRSRQSTKTLHAGMPTLRTLKMDGARSRFLPAATSTPTNLPTGPRLVFSPVILAIFFFACKVYDLKRSLTQFCFIRSDLNASSGSARSRRKRERLPQHRNGSSISLMIS